MTKFYLPFLIALCSISSQSTLLNIPKLKYELCSDSGDLISKNSQQIIDYLRRKQAESKRNCFDKNDLLKLNARLLLFAPIDSFYMSKKDYNKSEYPRYTLNKYLKFNTKLRKDELFRIKYFSNLISIPCYEISRLENFYFNTKENDSCFKYLTDKLNDYVLIEVNQVKGIVVLDDFPKNSISESNSVLND